MTVQTCPCVDEPPSLRPAAGCPLHDPANDLKLHAVRQGVNAVNRARIQNAAGLRVSPAAVALQEWEKIEKIFDMQTAWEAD